MGEDVQVKKTYDEWNDSDYPWYSFDSGNNFPADVSCLIDELKALRFIRVEALRLENKLIEAIECYFDVLGEIDEGTFSTIKILLMNSTTAGVPRIRWEGSPSAMERVVEEISEKWKEVK